MLILQFFLFYLLKESWALDPTCHVSILKHFDKEKIDERMVDKELIDRDFSRLFFNASYDLHGISFKNNSFTTRVFYHLRGNLQIIFHII